MPQTEITIFEDSQYSIIAEYESVKNTLGKYLIEHPNQIIYKKLLDAINEEKKRSKTNIDAFSLIMERNIISYEYPIALLLQFTNCYALCKEYNIVKYKIQTKEFGSDSGELCGSGGRMFLVKDEVIFQTLDWIS